MRSAWIGIVCILSLVACGSGQQPDEMSCLDNLPSIEGSQLLHTCYFYDQEEMNNWPTADGAKTTQSTCEYLLIFQDQADQTGEVLIEKRTVVLKKSDDSFSQVMNTDGELLVTRLRLEDTQTQLQAVITDASVGHQSISGVLDGEHILLTLDKASKTGRINLPNFMIDGQFTCL